MTTHPPCRLLLTLSVLLTVIGSPVGAGGPQRRNQGVKPPALVEPESRPWASLPPAPELTITLTARITFRDGPTATGMDSRALGWRAIFPRERAAEGATGSYSSRSPFEKTAWKTVKAGETAAFFASVGRSREAGGSADSCAIDLEPQPASGTPPDAIWKVEATIRSTSYEGTGVDRVTLDVKTRELGQGAASGTVEEVRTITMTSDQHHVLGMLSSPPAATSRCSSVLLDISASRRDDPASVADVIDYDVWLVHKDPTGREWRERREVDGTQRERVFVNFRNLAWSPAGERRETTGQPRDIVGRTVAEIGGWVRPDGRIDLSLGGLRSFDSAAGGISSGGFRQVTVGDGETTQVVLPQPTGRLRITAGAAESPGARGVVIQDGKPMVDLGQFFDRSVTSILVTARRRR